MEPLDPTALGLYGAGLQRAGRIQYVCQCASERVKERKMVHLVTTRTAQCSGILLALKSEYRESH